MTTFFHHRLAVLALVLLAMPMPLGATADGPDYWRVTVTAGSRLNIRTAPSGEAAVIGHIPAGTDGVVNLGCTGGLTLAEWQKASASERAAARRARWCRIEYDGLTGWVAGPFLAEGAGPAPSPAAPPLASLVNTEWMMPPEDSREPSRIASLGFEADGSAIGYSGCNRYRTTWKADGHSLTFGPVSITLMACPTGAQRREEQALTSALVATRAFRATTERLTLLDGAGEPLLVLLRRRE